MTCQIHENSRREGCTGLSKINFLKNVYSLRTLRFLCVLCGEKKLEIENGIKNSIFALS